MKLLYSVVVALVALAAVKADEPSKYDLSQAEPLFEKFIIDYNRQYKDEADRQVHFEAFKENLEKINNLQKDNPEATFGINKFADYTPEESKNLYGFRPN